MAQRHILLVTYPAQGHINPTLQFANRLINIGVRVTFVVSTYIKRFITKNPTLEEKLTFFEYSDGYDNGFDFQGGESEVEHYVSKLKETGSQALTDFITDSASKGCPVNCLVCTILLPWAMEVALKLHVPSAMLWIQPATVFDLYYYYFNGYADVIRTKTMDEKDSSCSIELPNLPYTFTSGDLPSFFLPTNTYMRAMPTFEEQFELLVRATKPKVLLNTFDELEPDALSAVGDKVTLIGIGPLIQSDNSLTANLFQPSDRDKYMDWLNSKPESSVIYVSFGSMAVLSKQQMEELQQALIGCGRPFLWVIRHPKKGDEDYHKIISQGELNGSMIVSWCAQVEVLSHSSVGCFVTHCGWNSTLESLVSGVPMVTFSQWSDQGTNSMLVEKVWKTGVRVSKSTNRVDLVEGDEIIKCLEVVMGEGERGDEIRRNARKWKHCAARAVEQGGSSDINLRAFVDQII